MSRTKKPPTYEQMDSKTKIKFLRSRIHYELASGIHTYHSCSCKRRQCRGSICCLCLIDKLVALVERKE